MRIVTRLAVVAALGLLLAACDKCGEPVKFFTPPSPASCSTGAPQG